LGLALAAESPDKRFFHDWKRASETPVLGPTGTEWESAGTFNPAVVARDGKFVMLYRAQDAAGTSRLGYAESTDGIHFKRRYGAVLSAEAEYEKGGGVEDPRLVQLRGRYYLTYTGYNKKDAQLCLAESMDLVHWNRLGVILPAYQGKWNRGWTKSGAIVAEKIAGKYWMYWLGTAEDKTDQMGVSSSTDMVHWKEETEAPVLPRRPGKFDREWLNRDQRRWSRRTASCWCTTERMTIWFIAQGSQCLTSMIREKSCIAAKNQFSCPRGNGRKTARCRMLCLWKEWRSAEKSGCFIMAAATSMWVWRLQVQKVNNSRHWTE